MVRKIVALMFGVVISLNAGAEAIVGDPILGADDPILG